MRRIKIVGDPGAVPAIGLLKNYLLSSGFSVDFPEDSGPDLVIQLDHHAHDYALIHMRQESPIAPYILRELSRIGLARVLLDWRDKNAGNYVKIAFNSADSQKIEMGLVNAISMAFDPQSVKRLEIVKKAPWWKQWLGTAGLVLLASNASAQVSPICLWDSSVSRCVGAGDWANRALRIVCLSGCGGAASFEDSDAFTAGTTAVNIGAGVFHDGLSDLTSGQAGAYRITKDRGVHVNLRDNAGIELPLPAALGGSGGLKVECLSGCGGAAAFEDEDAFTPGTTGVTTIGAFVDETTPDSCPENTSCAPRQSLNRNLYTQIRDAAGNERGVNVTAANALKVDGSAVTQPISAGSLPLPTGAATAANQLPDGHGVSQSGTWTVQPGNTANTTPWLMDIDQTGTNNDIDIVSSTLPTGASTLAEQQIQTTALQIIDDWDETDRAKVNPIVGQAGIQGASGVVTANTTRTVLATDVGLPAGTSRIGAVRPVDSADADLTSAKNAQTARFLGVQSASDTGRNQTNYFMILPIITTSAEVMMSMTGYKSGVAVGATTQPAVVTAGKTYRISSITVTYVAVAALSTARVTLRANLSGLCVIGSPLVFAQNIGAASGTAGASNTPFVIPTAEGIEFAAGTGICVGIQGYGPTMTAAAGGYAQVAIRGFEY
jgi:hypothetical protein